VGIALSKEKDADLLFETILTAAMDISDCDGGTLYIRESESLVFRTMITRSMNIHRNGKNAAVDLPPVPLSRRHVCACAALDAVLINLPDVYQDSQYDFSGARGYDALTGYQTVSMLVVPMENDYGEVIGVLQLINAKGSDGKIVPFDAAYEPVILSIASQAAICLTNMNYADEIARLFESFVRVMSAAIDERSPYNANHTRNMVKMGARFVDWLSESGNAWTFSQEEKRQFLMSIWLHDVGKLVIPLEIMDKETRLGERLADVDHRIEVFLLRNKINDLEGRTDHASSEETARSLNTSRELILKANTAGFLDDDTLESVRGLGALVFEDASGERQPLLTPEELIALSVRKGTLTDQERATMEGHVSMTAHLLDQMEFSRNYQKVPEWASAHHEYLNGQGYPNKLAGEKLPREVRLLTILDIFDALTARDRPYKPAMPTARAIDILSSMVRDGQLDEEIFALFAECAPWEA